MLLCIHNYIYIHTVPLLYLLIRFDDEQSLEGYLFMKGNKRRYWCVIKDDLFMYFNTKQVLNVIDNKDIFSFTYKMFVVNRICLTYILHAQQCFPPNYFRIARNNDYSNLPLHLPR